MSNLPARHVRLCESGWERGYRDDFIAKALGIEYRLVFNLRVEKGISVEEVQLKRYEYWEKLLLQGLSVTQVCAMYEVTPRGLKLALWKHRKFSFAELDRQTLENYRRLADGFFQRKNKEKGPLEWSLY
jgi:hypothetical protein